MNFSKIFVSDIKQLDYSKVLSKEPVQIINFLKEYPFNEYESFTISTDLGPGGLMYALSLSQKLSVNYFST